MRVLFRKRRTLILAVILIAVVGLAILLWPRPTNALELYTSPPIKLPGRTTRVQMMIPSGWTVQVEQGGGGPMAPRFFEIISVAPGPRYTWLPPALRRLLVAEPEANAMITVHQGTAGREKDGKMHLREDKVGAVKRYGAYRGVMQNGGHLMLYYRTDKAGFDATYRQVCESFQVIE